MSLPLSRVWRHAFVATLALCLAVTSLRSAAEDERISRLEDQIQTLDTVVASAKNQNEKNRLETKVQRLREELKILREREQIEAQQKALRGKLPASPLDAMREKLRAIDATVEEGDKMIADAAARRKQVIAERDAAQTQLARLKAKSAVDNAAAAEAEEQLFNANEELRALALQREAGEAVTELANEAKRLSDVIKTIELTSSPNLQMIFEAYARMRDERRTEDRLTAVIENVEQNLKVSRDSLTLSQQKLAKFDEELGLLEKQTGFFRKDPNVERLLLLQGSQKRALAERLPIIEQQVDALQRAGAALNARQGLIRAQSGMLKERYESLKSAYVKRLRWPAAAITGLLVVYALLHYVLLPLVYKKESLLLARRLGLYGVIVAGAGVVAGFLFDDLSMIASTMGIVSAALVISLQDVCTSVAGWFVIMFGGKFKIGDRLEVEGTCGDVIDIQLLRTTIIEINAWLDSDQPTGRVMVIPNNFIFKSKVFNYNHQHPYVWSKICLTVAPSTPVAEATAVFHQALAEESAEEFAQAQVGAELFRRKYGVDDAVYQPRISTTIVDQGVLLTLFFVSHYRRTVATHNRIQRRLIKELETRPQIQMANPTINIINQASDPASPTLVMGSAPTSGTRPPFGYPQVSFPTRAPVLPGN